MNVINVFKGVASSLINGCEQKASEKLIELATFFYKVDKRVSLEEQKYIDELMSSVDWDSSVSIESYQIDCVSKLNSIIVKPESEIFSYLSKLMEEITALGAVEKAKVIAKEISDADGEIADDEVKYLDLVASYE